MHRQNEQKMNIKTGFGLVKSEKNGGALLGLQLLDNPLTFPLND